MDIEKHYISLFAENRLQHVQFSSKYKKCLLSGPWGPNV